MCGKLSTDQNMGSRITQKLACCEKEGGGHTGVSEHKPRGRREAPRGTEAPHRHRRGGCWSAHSVLDLAGDWAQGCAVTATATRDDQEHGTQLITHLRRNVIVCAHIHHTDCMTVTAWAAWLREMRGPGQPPPPPTRSSPHPSAPIQVSAITRFPSMLCHDGYEVPWGQW